MAPDPLSSTSTNLGFGVKTPDVLNGLYISKYCSPCNILAGSICKLFGIGCEATKLYRIENAGMTPKVGKTLKF